MNVISFNLSLHPLGESHYSADCTFVAAQYSVATPWNKTTIPRYCALPCATTSAHSILPN